MEIILVTTGMSSSREKIGSQGTRYLRTIISIIRWRRMKKSLKVGVIQREALTS
jgi:hypothetical protein